MTEVGLTSFIRRSLAALERELPEVSARLCRTLSGRDVSITANGEDDPLILRFDRDRVQSVASRGRACVEVCIDRQAIVDLVDARTSLVDAILTDRLFIRGARADVLRFHDALTIYLHGAVRAPSFPHLLRSVRRSSPPACRESGER